MNIKSARRTYFEVKRAPRPDDVRFDVDEGGEIDDVNAFRKRTLRRAPPGYTRSRCALAIHEAAHAVAAFALGVAVRRITIASGSGAVAGRVDLGGPPLRFRSESWTDRDRVWIERSIMIALAANKAEQCFTGYLNLPPVDDLCLDSDDAHVENLAILLAIMAEDDVNDVQLQIRWLEHRTERLVASAWRQIEQVAALLLDRATLPNQLLANVR